MRSRVVSFALGVAVMGLVWGVTPSDTSPAPAPKEASPEVIIVPDTKTVYRDREVHTVSNECRIYLDAVDKVRAGQQLLSQSKGDLETVFDAVRFAAGTSTSGNDAAALQRKLEAVKNQMDNSWHMIGDGAAIIDQYQAGEGPCRK